MIGADAMNTPPEHAMAIRGIAGNVRGYMLFGNYQRPNPPARIVDAVADRQIDVALVWGPLAYDISMGVRRGNVGLREQV